MNFTRRAEKLGVHYNFVKNKYSHYSYLQTDEDADGNMTLTLRDVTPEVQGVYVVKAINNFGAVQSEANLTVTPKPKKMENVPPTFKVELANRTVDEQDPVRLECVVVGFPRPTVSLLISFSTLKSNGGRTVP